MSDVTRVYFSPLIGYPKWKVRCSVAAISLSEDAKVEYRTNRTPITTSRWQSEQWCRLQPRLLTLPGPAHTTDNFSPNEYREVVNPSGLDVYKGSNARDNNNDSDSYGKVNKAVNK